MFPCVSETRARWGRVLVMLTLTGLMTSMSTLAAADELPSVVATVQGQPIAAEDLTNSLRGELMRLDIQRHQILKEKYHQSENDEKKSKVFFVHGFLS